MSQIQDINYITMYYEPTFISAKILLLPKHVEEELVSGAALHAGGVSLVEQDGGHPGKQERHPASQHYHPHLVFIVKL